MSDTIQGSQADQMEGVQTHDTPDTLPHYGLPAVDSGARGILPGSLSGMRYKMDHPKRGICAIFNIEKFSSTGHADRAGSSEDVAKIKRTFENMGFQCIEFKNATAKQMKQTFLDLSRVDYSNSDCFVCWILTHGKMGSIYATDDEISLDLLAHYFTGDSCPTLFGKPKLFFIQACQEKEDPKSVWESDSKPSAKDWGYRIPAFADFFFGFSTPPGYYSWRSPSIGSYYVNYFCKIFDECVTPYPLVDLTALMELVAMKLALEFTSNTPSNIDMHNKMQIPCYMSTLTRRVYFSKKL